MEKLDNIGDPKYAKFLKMRRVGISDEAVSHAMILSGLDKDCDALAVFGADRLAATPAGPTRAERLNRDHSLLIYHSNEIHLSGKTSLSDPLMNSIFRRWEATSAGPLAEEHDICQVCFEGAPESQLIRTCELGVPYCMDCVASFLTGDIREARVSEEGCDCLCRSCNSKFSEEDIRRLVSPDILQKFIKFRNAKLVENNSLKVYCPSPTCASVVTLSREGATRAQCQSCNTKFCVKCGGEHNVFVSCEWAADSGFRKWKGNTPDGCKRCPNCRLFIEKDGGCSHMTCRHCHHGFCWICMSNWSNGCSAGKFCVPLKIIRSEVWGPVPVLRETAQAVGITTGLIVCLGLAGAAVGVAAAAGAAVVGVGIPVVIVGGPIYGAYRGAKKIKKNYLRKKRQQAMRGGANRDLDADDANDLRNELKWGIRVYLDCATLRARGLSNDENTWMGMSGRMVDGILIAYPDFGSRLDGSSPPLYIIPNSAADHVVEQVAGWSMVQVSVNTSSGNNLVDDVASSVRSQFDRSRGYASIRCLPHRPPRSNAKGEGIDDSALSYYYPTDDLTHTPGAKIKLTDTYTEAMSPGPPRQRTVSC